MWHNARLLNLVASGMFLLSGLILAQIGWVLTSTSQRFALQQAVVVGVPQHVTRDQVSDAISGRALGNFFSADIAQVKRLVESIPWVRTADVRRQWPDRIEIRIEEHKALGRWGADQLISVRGELFVAPVPAGLPRLVGPEGSEQDVARRYYRFRELAKPLAAEPVEVTLSPRYAWTLRLSNGLVAELGRDQAKAPVEARLQRYVGLHGIAVEQLGRNVTHVDLRYPNGFAVRVVGLGAEPVRPARPAGKKG